jgi:anti-anti-sigma regulatory factor
VGSIARRRAPAAALGPAHRARRTVGPVALPARLQAELVGNRLTLTGQLDGRGASVLHGAVSSLLRTGHSSWTIDAARLVVRDDDALRALVGCYQRALRHDRRVTLHGAAPPLRQALARLRLDVHLLPREEGSSRRHGTST